MVDTNDDMTASYASDSDIDEGNAPEPAESDLGELAFQVLLVLRFFPEVQTSVRLFMMNKGLDPLAYESAVVRMQHLRHILKSDTELNYERYQKEMSKIEHVQTFCDFCVLYALQLLNKPTPCPNLINFNDADEKARRVQTIQWISQYAFQTGDFDQCLEALMNMMSRMNVREYQLKLANAPIEDSSPASASTQLMTN